MIRRQTYIENRRVLADSGEVTTPIGLRDTMTALYLEFRATNGASYNCAQTLADCITSIEILDGANTLISLTGKQAAALYWSRLNWMPYNLVSEFASNVQNLYVPILFGRWLGDQQFAFDPSKFSNPVIKIKWNLATVNAVGATGFVTGSGTFTAIADIMEGVPAPVAMLTAKQHYSFSTAASGTEYIDLPVDQRLSKILLTAWATGQGALYGISNVKISCDNGKVIPLDMRSSDFMRHNTRLLSPLTYKHDFMVANAETIYSVLKKDETLALIRDGGDTVYGYMNTGIGQGAVTVTTGGSADANKRVTEAIVSGFCPYGSSLYHCGEWDDPSTWLSPAAFRSMRLELTQNAASSACSVVLETEYDY